MDEPYPKTSRTTPHRRVDRLSYDRVAAHAILDEAISCHVGFVVDGRPVVLPQLHARVGDVPYLHGSTGAGSMLAARPDGLDVCVTVTLVDALVLARAALNHSANYRCVMAHGRARLVEDPDEKQRALAAVVDAVVPGRSAKVRGPSRKELATTAVLRLDLAEVSVKVRSGPPADDEADLGLPNWAGVLPGLRRPALPCPRPTCRRGPPCLSTSRPGPARHRTVRRPLVGRATLPPPVNGAGQYRNRRLSPSRSAWS